MIKSTLSFFIVSLLFLSSSSWGFSPQCRDFLLPPVPKLQLNEIDELKIGTYNVLNLNHSVGKYETRGGKQVFVPGAKAKPDWQQQQVADAIRSTNLDIIVIQEVEGAEALEDFANTFLEGVYHPILMKGNDERGIEIGFLVKKNLPFEIEMNSYSALTWSDPLNGGRVDKLFSRDLPIMNIYFSSAQPRGPPDLILIGTHFKSQRGTAADPTSKVKREAQVVETTKIIKGLKEKHGSRTPILLAGDFNGDINNPEFVHLRQNGLLEEALELKGIPKEERVTHTYHPRNGPTQNSQLDAIMFTPDFGRYVEEAGVYRYRDEAGQIKPLPRTYAEREKNPSDHFMTWLKVNFNSFRNR